MPATHTLTNPGPKLKKDVRLKVRIVAGWMYSNPMTYFDADRAVSVLRYHGYEPDTDFTIVPETKSLRRECEQKAADGKAQKFQIASAELPNGELTSGIVVAPPGMEVEDYLAKAQQLGPPCDIVCCDPGCCDCGSPADVADIQVTFDDAGSHPHCGQIPTGHYEAAHYEGEPESEHAGDLPIDGPPTPRDLEQQRLQQQSLREQRRLDDYRRLTETISTLGLIVLAWTCWQIVGGRLARKLARVLARPWHVERHVELSKAEPWKEPWK